jgi:hypothetical protein
MNRISKTKRHRQHQLGRYHNRCDHAGCIATRMMAVHTVCCNISSLLPGFNIDLPLTRCKPSHQLQVVINSSFPSCCILKDYAWAI